MEKLELVETSGRVCLWSWDIVKALKTCTVAAGIV